MSKVSGEQCAFEQKIIGKNDVESLIRKAKEWLNAIAAVAKAFATNCSNSKERK